MSRGVSTALAIAMVTAVTVGAQHGGSAVAPSRAFDVAVTGSGPAVILIPGLSTTGEVWATTVAHLADRYELHVLTLAGFGGPEPLGDPFLPRVADALIQYVRSQQLDRPVVLGHSLGGFLAFKVAATAPDLFGGVVAVDGVPFLTALGNPSATADSQRAQASQLKAMYASFTPEQGQAQGRLALAGMITAPADVERAAAWAAKADAGAVGVAVAELMTTDLREAVARITAPVLLIGALGAAPEAMWPAFRSSYEAQVARVPDATVVFAERARHFVMLDDPDFLFGTLDQFFAALTAGSEAAWTLN